MVRVSSVRNARRRAKEYGVDGYTWNGFEFWQTNVCNAREKSLILSPMNVESTRR